MPMQIFVRLYNASDFDAVIALFRYAVRTIASQDYTYEQVMAWAPDEINSQKWVMKLTNKLTWVALIGDKIVGFTDLESDGHIDMLYVHADYQNQGVASRLLETVESKARNALLSQLYTEASITARRFFERRGFQIITSQTVRFGGQEFLNFRMQKQL